MYVRLIALIAVSLLTATACATPCADDNASGCAQTAVQAAENEMDDLFQQLIEQQGRHSVLSKRLINTQRAWRTFRDSECEYVGTYGEHEGEHQDSYDRCVQMMTERRTQILLHYQECQTAHEQCAVSRP